MKLIEIRTHISCKKLRRARLEGSEKSEVREYLREHPFIIILRTSECAIVLPPRGVKEKDLLRWRSGKDRDHVRDL